MERVRQFWESWLLQYDQDKKPSLAARFQSYDNHPHLSAFLELFTFAALRRAGYQVEIEPSVGQWALEFLARMDEPDLKFYCECTATGQRAEEAGADAIESDILDAIDNVPTRRFLLGVRFLKRGRQSPSITRLRQGLTEWLSSLEDRSSISDSNPEWVWEDRGWSVRFWVFPPEPDDTEAEGGLGMIGPEVFDAKEHLRLRRAIDRKASKYGTVGAPLLVLTNSTEHQTERDLMTALLGDVQWQINMVTRDVSVTRKPNGVFYDTNGPRNVTLSAVMHECFGALSFADKHRSFVLVHHPFASHPLPRGLFPFCEERHFDSRTGEMVTTPPTVTIGEFFDLPSGWPFFDKDQRGGDQE